MRTVRIPKVDPDLYHEVKIYKKGLSRGNMLTHFKFKEQVIAGITIPKKTECSCFNNQCLIDDIGSEITLELEGVKLNEILRTLWIDAVKNGEYDETTN